MVEDEASKALEAEEVVLPQVLVPQHQPREGDVRVRVIVVGLRESVELAHAGGDGDIRPQVVTRHQGAVGLVDVLEDAVGATGGLAIGDDPEERGHAPVGRCRQAVRPTVEEAFFNTVVGLIGVEDVSQWTIRQVDPGHSVDRRLFVSHGYGPVPARDCRFFLQAVVGRVFRQLSHKAQTTALRFRRSVLPEIGASAVSHGDAASEGPLFRRKSGRIRGLISIER